MKYVMMPAMAKKRHPKVEAREKFLAEAANQLPVNVVRMRDTSVGIITSGVCYQYVRDAMPFASTLKLGMVYPLPMKLIREFAQKVDRLIVVEELEGLILLASYPVKDINEKLETIIIYGSEDKVVNMKGIDEADKYIKGRLEEYIIEGGNHAQFGSYGPQKGDGTATITGRQQQEEAAKYIIDLAD